MTETATQTLVAHVAPRRVSPRPVGRTGPAVALLILVAWATLLGYLLAY